MANLEFITEKSKALFWAKVDMSAGPDGCWPWIASRISGGYGRVGIGGRLYLAHRVAWELIIGPIPSGETSQSVCVLHRCDNPPCVNPAHLSIGTMQDNCDDMLRKGRHRVLSGDENHMHSRPEIVRRGSNHHGAKINESDVRDIRIRLAAGEGCASIARDYPVNKNSIDFIKRGINWRHVK